MVSRWESLLLRVLSNSLSIPRKGNGVVAAGDFAGSVLGAIGITLSWRTATLIWNLKSLVVPMSEAKASGNTMAVIMLVARSLGINPIKASVDRKDIQSAVYSAALGAWAAVGTGEAEGACG
jgi:hypothetical protein